MDFNVVRLTTLKNEAFALALQVHNMLFGGSQG